MYGVLAHGIPSDNPPEDFWGFLNDYWWPKVEDALDKEMCLQQLNGHVQKCSYLGQLPSTTSLKPKYFAGWARHPKDEVVSAGIRGILSFEATERSGNEIGKLGIQENLSFHEKTQDDPLISAMMCLHTTFTCSQEFISEAFSLAKQSN